MQPAGSSAELVEQTARAHAGATAATAPAGGSAGTDSGAAESGSDEVSALTDTALDPNRPTLRPKLFWFNLSLTAAVIVLLILDLLPLPYLFMLATVVALMVNFPKMKDQAKEIAAHSSAIISVVAMVMAAAVLTGVMSGTGMVDAMAAWLVDVIPTSWGPFLAVLPRDVVNAG